MNRRDQFHETEYDWNLAVALTRSGVSSSVADRLTLVICQLHYLLNLRGEADRDEHHRVWHSYESLRQWFPSWGKSDSNLRRAIGAGVRAGFILKRRTQRENLYSLDYGALLTLMLNAGVEPSDSMPSDIEERRGVHLSVKHEHTDKALHFLEESDREFAEGERLQASEKLWGAATHAVMAVAQERGWDDSSHRALKNAVIRLSDEEGGFAGRALRGGFVAAEKFHSNFYHNNMEDFEIEADRADVHRFVSWMLGLLE